MITKKTAYKTFYTKIDSIGVTTNDYSLGCDMEIESKVAKETGDLTILRKMKPAFKAVGLMQGHNDYEMVSIEDIDEETGRKVWKIHKLTESEAENIRTRMKYASCTIANVIKIGIDLQNLGRQAQEGDIDAFKTFELLIKVFKKELRLVRNRVKHMDKVEINWTRGSLDSMEIQNDSEKTEYYDSSTSKDMIDCVNILTEEFEEMINRKQKLNRIKAKLEEKEYKMPDSLRMLVKLIQGQFMTLSQMRLKKKRMLKEKYRGELDKVAREALSADFDELFDALRYMLRYALLNHKLYNQYSALVLLKEAINKCDTLDNPNVSDIIATYINRLLAEEMMLTSVYKNTESKDKLVDCSLPEGSKVRFEMGRAITEEGYAIGYHTKMLDGIYTIKYEDDNWYACKNLRQEIIAQIHEQMKKKLFLVKLTRDTSKEALDKILNAKEIILEGLNKSKNSFENVYVGEEIVAHYNGVNARRDDGTRYNTADIKKANSIFDGTYLLKQVRTFNTEKGIQYYMLLERK